MGAKGCDIQRCGRRGGKFVRIGAICIVGIIIIIEEKIKLP